MNERLKELRSILHLTQQEFADKLGIKRSTVATYEVRKGAPSDAAVLLICSTFGVREEWLRSGIGEIFAPEPESKMEAFAREHDLNDFERNFLERYLRLGKREREAVTAFMEALACDSINAFLGAIPKTPEELESQYPPVSDSTHKAI